MNWFFKFLSSSVGKKALMAVTGLLLCGFLVAHLAGNLLLYVSADAYNAYAHKLHEQKELLVVAEIGLFAVIILHLMLAVKTESGNSAARSTDYAVKQTKQKGSVMAFPAHSTMWFTGVVVLVFMLLHLADFKFELRGEGIASLTPYAKAERLLEDKLTFIVYIIGSLVLGYHLSHGFQSSFQTLGLNHPKYTNGVKAFSRLFALIIALGFASFPLWANLFEWTPKGQGLATPPKSLGQEHQSGSGQH